MRKLAVVIILVFFVLLVLIPSEVRAALGRGDSPRIFQQIATAYVIGDSTITVALSTAYGFDSVTPPTASFGTSAQSTSTTRTLTNTPTRTSFPATGFVTATSSYANTAAAIRTAEALTIQAATRNSPLYTPGTPSPSPIETETPTLTGTSMPSWTASPSLTTYPTVITTPRVLQKGETNSSSNFRLLLIGLGILGLICFLIVGLWFISKKR